MAKFQEAVREALGNAQAPLANTLVERRALEYAATAEQRGIKVLIGAAGGVDQALGATQWQTIRHVVLRKAAPGVMAAIVLGLSRAFGETMAVLMVAGNVAAIPSSVFDPAYPLPALIANKYGEMLSVPMYDSALLLASLILLVVVLVVNFMARVILLRVERSVQ